MRAHVHKTKARKGGKSMSMRSRGGMDIPVQVDSLSPCPNFVVQCWATSTSPTHGQPKQRSSTSCMPKTSKNPGAKRLLLDAFSAEQLLEGSRLRGRLPSNSCIIYCESEKRSGCPFVETEQPISANETLKNASIGHGSPKGNPPRLEISKGNYTRTI